MKFHELVDVSCDITNHALYQLLNEALACTNCGARYTSLTFKSTPQFIPKYAVTCLECKHIGPFAKNPTNALKKWNRSKSWIDIFL